MSRTISRDEVNYLRRTETDLKLEEERLTERQREVLQLLAEGRQMKEIGSILNMTTRTVAFTSTGSWGPSAPRIAQNSYAMQYEITLFPLKS